MASGLSTQQRPGLRSTPNPHDALKGLFEADWASIATTCESFADLVQGVDWESIGREDWAREISLDLDEEDAGELRAWAHAVGQMCEKVQLGWA